MDRASDRDLLRDICRRGAPLLPSGSTRLALELARDESLNDDVLVEHLESDPRLRYGVLIGANASLFEVKRSTKTVRQALGQLGRSRCQSVLWLVALSDFLRASGQMPERARLRLWKHSLLTAVVAYRLLCAARIDQAPEALSAGMAHDLGHLLLASPAARLGIVWHEEHEQLAERGHSPPPELDHCRLGAALLELWDAPAALVAAARDHHQPALAPEGVRPIISGVRMADILAEFIERERTDRALHLERSERWTELASLGPWAQVPRLHETAIELLPEALLTAEHLANLLGN